MTSLTTEQVQWTERPGEAPAPVRQLMTATVAYRGLNLKVEESSSPGYTFWSVAFQLGSVWSSAGGFGRMTLAEAKAAAIDVADRLLAAGAEVAS